MNDFDLRKNNTGLRFYNSIAPLYNLLHKTQAFRSGGETNIRKEFLKELEIKEDDRVLEVSVGTGANLSYLPKFGQYYGIDISMEMLRRCKKRIKREGINGAIVMGTADNLPFASDVFDWVFSICAFRLFDDKSRALQEMVRVAKPGSKIMIVDQRKAGVSLEDVPQELKQVRAKEFPAWDLYCLSFQKPKIKKLCIFTT